MKIEGLLGPERSYVCMLNESLLAKQQADNDGPKRFFPLRPSAAGYCARALAYALMEFKGLATYPAEERSPEVIRLLNFGNSVEYNVLRLLGDVEAFEVRYKQQALSFFQIPTDDQRLIEGSIDFVLYSPNHRAVGDVKSKKDKYSSWTESNWKETDEKFRRMSTVQEIPVLHGSDTAFWIPDLPAFLKELNDPFLADNFVQLCGYAMNPFIRERGIDHAFLLQYNKNTSAMRELRFAPSKEVADYIQEKFTQVALAVEQGKPELVEREYSLGSLRCAFCRFAKECYPDANSKKEYFATWPDKDWPRDTNRLGEIGEALEELYSVYAEADIASGRKKNVEEGLCSILHEKKIRKVRFADGRVYELRFFKSPRPHFELRPGKL